MQLPAQRLKSGLVYTACLLALLLIFLVVFLVVYLVVHLIVYLIACPIDFLIVFDRLAAFKPHAHILRPVPRRLLPCKVRPGQQRGAVLFRVVSGTHSSTHSSTHSRIRGLGPEWWQRLLSCNARLVFGCLWVPP